MAVRRKKWTSRGPNKLHQSDIITFSEDPLLGALVLQTDDGCLDMAINKTVAHQLHKALTEFLEGQGKPLRQ